MPDVWDEAAKELGSAPHGTPQQSSQPAGGDPWAAASQEYTSLSSGPPAAPNAPSGHGLSDIADSLTGAVRGLVNTTVNPFAILGSDIQGRANAGAQADQDYAQGKYGAYAAHKLESLIPFIGSMANAYTESDTPERAKILSQASKDWNSGNYGSSAVKALEGMVPFIGPAVARAGQAAHEGRWGDYGNEVGSIGGMLMAPKVIEAIPGAARFVANSSLPTRVKGALQNFTKVDPTIAAIKAWSPTPTESGFADRLPETLSKIQDAYGKPIETNDEAVKAAQQALDQHDEAFNAWMNRARSHGVKISGDAIVKATQDAIPETLWRENPDAARAIVSKAQKAYGGKDFTVDQIEKFRKEKTAALKSFYDGNTSAQIAHLSAGDSAAVLKAQRDTIANSLYNALDPQNGGAGPRQIKLSKSDIIDVKKAAERRQNVATGSKPVSRASAVAGAAPKAMQSIMSGPGLGYIKAADITNPETLFAGQVDPWVRKAFKAVGKSGNPIPLPGLMPYRAMLGPATQGPIVGPGGNPIPMGPERVVPTVNVGPLVNNNPAGVAGARLLGAGPEAEPGVSSSTGPYKNWLMRQMAQRAAEKREPRPPLQLPPASKGLPPDISTSSVEAERIGSRHGDATSLDLIPVQDSQGNVRYVPRSLVQRFSKYRTGRYEP